MDASTSKPNPGPALPRSVPLPKGRVLTVRAATPADVDAVLALYRSMSSEDRYRRFFSSFRPTASFVASWLSAGDRGGCSIVATVDEGTPSAEVVGEAGYVSLPDGSAEFALTVAPAWRGWLGPWLLDVLVDEAASRGVTVLQAEILAENRAMRTVTMRRGEAVLERPDWTVVRVAVATTGRVPPWPPGERRRRVLVEAPGGHWRAESDLRAAGYAVATCAGPDRPGGCPALDGAPCPLADGATVIVCALPPGDERAAELLAAHQAHRADHGDAALVLDAPLAAGPTAADADLRACRTGAEVVRRIDRLVIERRARS